MINTRCCVRACQLVETANAWDMRAQYIYSIMAQPLELLGIALMSEQAAVDFPYLTLGYSFLYVYPQIDCTREHLRFLTHICWHVPLNCIFLVNMVVRNEETVWDVTFWKQFIINYISKMPPHPTPPPPEKTSSHWEKEPTQFLMFTKMKGMFIYSVFI